MRPNRRTPGDAPVWACCHLRKDYRGASRLDRWELHQRRTTRRSRGNRSRHVDRTVPRHLKYAGCRPCPNGAPRPAHTLGIGQPRRAAIDACDDHVAARKYVGAKFHQIALVLLGAGQPVILTTRTAEYGSGPVTRLPLPSCFAITCYRYQCRLVSA